MREDILKIFPPPPGLAGDISGCLKRIDEIYVGRAQLSLDQRLQSERPVDRARSLGNWNPDSIKGDRDHRDALAARGYWQAFQTVKDSVERVLRGKNAGKIADEDHAV
ncbi:hypothetical protein [Povalibacter sp.]|uniref:hypothetical protein n=1 Tax=Povalibacter sp. TaxID=1962978 RepID=UPI002F3E405E